MCKARWITKELKTEQPAPLGDDGGIWYYHKLVRWRIETFYRSDIEWQTSSGHTVRAVWQLQSKNKLEEMFQYFERSNMWSAFEVFAVRFLLLIHTHDNMDDAFNETLSGLCVENEVKLAVLRASRIE